MTIASISTAQAPQAPQAFVTNKTYPQLVDIAPQTGIHFEHVSSPDQKFIVESMGGGVAILDYDGDGWPDIYFTNGPTVDLALKGKTARRVLYRNNHDGTFTDVSDKAGVATPCWAMGVSVGDYNNDGHPDMLVTCFGGVVLYRNNGDGTFTDATKAAGLDKDKAWATGAAFGDYDHDGNVDLFVSHYVDFHLDDLPTFGSAKTCQYLGQQVQCGPRGLKGSGDSLYHNNGDGTFTDVSVKSGVSDPEHRFGLTAIWSDLENNGNLDLFVTNDGQANYLYHNDGKGNFTDIGLVSGVASNEDGAEQANMGIAHGDYLNNGSTSLLISHFDNEYAALYRNDGDGGFTDTSSASGIKHSTQGYVGWGDAFSDFDNDGWKDILLVNGHVYPQVDNAHQSARYLEPKKLLRNRHDGSFEDISQQNSPAIRTPQVSRGLAIGDLFNDGKLQAVVENLAGQPMILRPAGDLKSQWISFQLEGTKTNRLALNARVTITCGELTQMQEITSSGSYLSQDDLRLHFGLGQCQRIDKASVQWSGGKTEPLSNLVADRYLKVREGAGVISSEPAARPIANLP
jgi:enediyne biosynthesis protein E4